MTTVFFATPTRGELRLEHAMFREYVITSERRYQLHMHWASGYPAGSVRCKIALSFLKSDADFLLMLDSDQAPTDNPLDYIGRDLDVLAFPSPTYRGMDKLPIRWFPEPEDPERGIVPMNEATTGCMLIARRVLEHPAMRAPFLDEYNADGIFESGEDQTFCRRARAAGFGVWCAMNAPLAHFKTVELLTIWRAYGLTGKPDSLPNGEGGASRPHPERKD